MNKLKRSYSDSGELGWVNLFKRRISYFCVFAMFKRGKPLEFISRLQADKRGLSF